MSSSGLTSAGALERGSTCEKRLPLVAAQEFDDLGEGRRL